jgi:Aerotolerance regulator N-terminal/von Willebrand factor type A domain
MGLLSPWFLAGVAAVGVPLYLHLLQRHTTNPQPVGSLMFFEQRTQSSIKHRRLRYLLLLSLRLALVLLLVLAFANPFINRPAASASGDKLELVVVDNSFSMRAGSRLADAKREAESVLAARSPTVRGQVATLGSQLHILTQPIQDAGALRSAVDGIEPGDSRGSFGELARSVRSLAENIHTPIELHLLSDMQSANMPTNFSELALPANVTLVLHPVVKDPVPNWTVESVNAAGQVWDPKKARVQAVIAGYGTPAAMRTVSLIVNGKTIGTNTVQVPANGRATVNFQTLDVPYGFSHCEVKIDSADAFPADDVNLFAVERSDPERVLFVHEAIDRRSPLYFSAALTAAAESAFTLQVVAVEQLNAIDPSKFAFVVLSDVVSLPATFANDLDRYVRGGGSVLVAAGTNAGRTRRIPVFGDRILDSHYYSRDSGGYLTIGDSDPSHPSMAKSARWAGVKFYYATRVDASNSRVVARLSDQTPLLLDKKIGEGRVLLLASGLDNLSNDFPLNPVFVPFVEQTARYLSGTESRSGSRLVDSYLELRTAKEQAVGVEVVDPVGRRPLSLKEASTAQSYQLTQSGFYQLRLANGRQDVIGVNPDRRESNLDVIPDETLALWRGKTSTTAEQASATGQTQQKDQPYRLWWYLMLLVLGAAVAESLLASRYLATQREQL